MHINHLESETRRIVFRHEHTNILKRLIALLLKGRRLQRITIITVVSDEKL